jgi:hypothetical protein
MKPQIALVVPEGRARPDMAISSKSADVASIHQFSLIFLHTAFKTTALDSKTRQNRTFSGFFIPISAEMFVPTRRNER